LPQYSQLTRKESRNPKGSFNSSRQYNRPSAGYFSSGRGLSLSRQEDEADDWNIMKLAAEDRARRENRLSPGFSLANIQISPEPGQLSWFSNLGSMMSVDMSPVQAKLAINQPGDRYEEEADRVAEQVMRMPETRIANRSEMAQPPIMRRSCPKCRKKASERKEVEERLQMKPLSTCASHFVQTSPSNVPPIVHEVLRSPGRPLDSATRAFMEPRFGCDFSRVRVHTDARAAESARSVNALAYTVGRDLVFASNLYTPQTNGRWLLAHELVHVMQQQDSNCPQSGRVQRACGSAAIDEPTGCTTTDRGIQGLRYLFKVNCDDFASGNEEDLRMKRAL